MYSRFCATVASCTRAVPIFAGDVLRVPGAPRSAAVRRHASHASYTPWRAASGMLSQNGSK